MRSYHLSIALVSLLVACGSDTPSTPDPLEEEPGPPGPASSLALSADSIFLRAFLGGDNPNPGEVRITSTTGTQVTGLAATVTYGPGQPVGWLYTWFDVTSTPARLGMLPSTDSLPVGEWWADVSISAPGAGAPRVVRLHFSVLPRSSVDSANVIISLGGYTNYDRSPGTGVLSGGGFHCSKDGGVCSQKLPVGSTFTLTATPDPDNFFLEWQVRQPGEDGRLGCGNGPTCDQLVVAGGLEIYAFFALDGYSVQVNVAGENADGFVEGWVSPNPPIDCQLTAGVQSGQCLGQEWYGARSVTLTAHALTGSSFVGFSGDCTGSGTECVLPPRPGGSYTVTATFAKQ